MVKMVDIGNKRDLKRTAIASGEINLKRSTIHAIRSKKVVKGDVIGAAEVAALQAIKKVWEVLPHCHQIPITAAEVQSKWRRGSIEVTVTVQAVYRTGVEMEALYGVSVALLTVWDMVKTLEKDENGQYPATRIGNIRVKAKVKGDD